MSITKIRLQIKSIRLEVIINQRVCLYKSDDRTV